MALDVVNLLSEEFRFPKKHNYRTPSGTLRQPGETLSPVCAPQNACVGVCKQDHNMSTYAFRLLDSNAYDSLSILYHFDNTQHIEQGFEGIVAISHWTLQFNRQLNSFP